MSVLQDPSLDRLLDRLHARSDAQVEALTAFAVQRERSSLSDEEVKRFRSDKYVALDRDKAEFCYQLCRATGARRIVEIGTSFGVSTLYLAAAVRDNGGGTVIGTEYEPEKAKAARANFAEAGLADFIDLREGDLRQTLKDLRGPTDFALIDIWIPMARPALELIYPRLRSGAIVVCDNTAQLRADYADYLAFIGSPENGFRTMTLPFGGGLEFSVYCGNRPNS
jgi:predicted O-methyltransferase YrrM